jgi:transposase
VLLVYLPPYSPNMNPIERVFSVLKSRLKREGLLTGMDEDPNIIKDFIPKFLNADLMTALFQGSGY